ncbi:hypothetical protein AS200_17470 [Streptomyces sp. CdTB01]|nr:hypothetical protein AS200_17470 [Streptomyces sp. CdTB01]
MAGTGSQDSSAVLPLGSPRGSAPPGTYAAHSGLWQGPGVHSGTQAPSVLCRLTTVSTGCPQTGQTWSELSMPPG